MGSSSIVLFPRHFRNEIDVLVWHLMYHWRIWVAYTQLDRQLQQNVSGHFMILMEKHKY